MITRRKLESLTLSLLVNLALVTYAHTSMKEVATSNEIDFSSTSQVASQQNYGEQVDNQSSNNEIETHQHVACGSTVNNITNIIVKNPHHPGPTYTKGICEAVIERAGPTITKLSVTFKQLNLYRPTIDGECMHDRFAVYTDLNAIVTPVICGNQTGKTISVPFMSPLTNLIVSITTSDLDHDRLWEIEVEQGE